MAEAKPKSQKTKNLVEELYYGTAEKTVSVSGYVEESLYRPYNPDDIWQKTGNYEIYEDMVKDDQVNVCLRLKQDLVVGTGWDIVCEEEGHEEIKEDIEVALKEDMDVSIDDILEEITSAYAYGFSLSEKIFKYRGDGSLTLKNIKTRHPATWLIHTDDFGNVERYEQQGYEANRDIEPKSLIHYVVNRRFQNPYGTSDLRSAYAAWFAKRQVIRYYAIFLEKAASPTPVARYDKNAPQSAVDAIHTAIKSFQSKTALTIPKEIEVEFLESKSNGEAYEKAISIFNMFIGRSLFIPDLLGLHGAQTSGGSYSLGVEQMAMFMKHIGRRRAAVEDIVNRELIWPLVFHNHGYIDNYPKFKLRPISDTEAVEASKIWLDAVKSRVFKPTEEEINHFRGIVKFPEGDVEYGEIQEIPSYQGGAQRQSEAPIKDKEERENEEAVEETTGGTESGADTFKAQTDQEENKLNFALGPYPPGDYYKKCDFKAIQKNLDSFDESIKRDLTPIITLAVEDLYDQVSKKKIVQNNKVERLDDLKLKKLGDMKSVMKKSMRDLWREGKLTAQSELFKGTYANSKFVPDDTFAEVLDAEIFQYIGDWAYAINKAVKIQAIAAIKDGESISTMIAKAIDKTVADAIVSAERFARTKHTEVFNKGRVSFFEESGVVQAYQYSAILDGRTSEICRNLDGKIFEAGKEPIPPMHFNCRSLLIPISKYEEVELPTEAQQKKIDAFIEENKGAGFPTR